ncbi:YraN family protein [Tepidicella baoligensis]|uniref:YraN family protein n=1 Tax=Tepidicella baoligensis TaxID=2707016 RepID=UPI0015D9E517|nr:YraN family protein [Tepidicella baoligensis]
MSAGSIARQGQGAAERPVSTRQRGDAAEDRALAFLQARGLRLLRRHFHTPGRGGGEIDLVMQAADGTVVFVEVRQRRSRVHGGAAASVGGVKQRRLIFAARHYLSRLPSMPPCRFDVVAIQGEGGDEEIEWIEAAFTADGW